MPGEADLPGDLALAAALNARGLRCKDAGQFEEGRAHYQRALALLERVVDPPPSAIATLYHNLGGIAHAAGDFAAGEAPARRGLAIRLASGADPREIAADQVALAAILDGLERYDEAEGLYAEALEVLECAPVENAVEIAVALNDLGAQYERRGRIDEAEELLRRAVAIKTATLGAGHPDLAVSLHNLAVVRRRLGDAAEAAALHADALAIFERELGAGHPKTVACRGSSR